MRESRPLSLLIRNLRYTTSPECVRQLFEQFDYYTRLPRGFGFVEFVRDEDAEVALRTLSRNATLDGAEISVTMAQQGRKSPDSMRRRERSLPREGSSTSYRVNDHDSSHHWRRGGRRDDSSGAYRHRSRYSRSRSRSYCADDTRRRHDARHYRYHDEVPRWSSSARYAGSSRRDDAYRGRYAPRQQYSVSPEERYYRSDDKSRKPDVYRRRDDRHYSSRADDARPRRASSRSADFRPAPLDRPLNGQDAVSDEQSLTHHRTSREEASFCDAPRSKSPQRSDEHRRSPNPSESPDRRVHNADQDFAPSCERAPSSIRSASPSSSRENP